MTKMFKSSLHRLISEVSIISMIVALIFVNAPQQTFALKGNKAGLRTMEKPELLPFWLPAGTQTKQYNSYDASSGNFDWGIVRYTENNGERVIFDEYGSGCLYRQQMNIWHTPVNWTNVHIRMYFDDEATPRLDIPVNSFFGVGQNYTAPFTQPISFFDTMGSEYGKSNFAICYYPFAFKRHLKITFTNVSDGMLTGNQWYQYTYLKYPTTKEVKTWTAGDDSKTVRNQWNNLGVDPKSATGNVNVTNSYTINNGTSATVLDISGQGSLTSLKFTMNTWNSNTFNKVKIKIFWDNAADPAVDMSLGSFFGGGGETLGKTVYNRNFTNLFYGYNYTNKHFYCYWPMPYWSRARVVIENNSGMNITSFGVNINFKSSKSYSYPSSEAGYFHAKRTIDISQDAAYYSNAFEDWGKGKVVGIMMYTSSGFCMDGDEFTYIDDSDTPSIHGDGTEDDHNQGWGGNAYQKPLWGGLISGFDGGYRTYYNDSYIYDRHIKIRYEHSNNGGASQIGQGTDCIFWYYKKDAGNGSSGNLKLTDELNVGHTTSEISHSYSIKTETQHITTASNYDGYEQNTAAISCNDSGRSFKGYSKFKMKIDPNNNGVLLRKRLNRYNNNIQKADVYVDGVKVKEQPWYFCDVNSITSNQAFANSNFVIPSSYTRRKSSITVKIQYLSAKDTTHGINEYYYWAYSYVPTTIIPQIFNTVNIAIGATASASSVWGAHYAASGTNDNDGITWLDAYIGGTMDDIERIRFTPRTSQRVRLLVNDTTGNTPSIKEFRVFNEASGTLLKSVPGINLVLI